MISKAPILTFSYSAFYLYGSTYVDYVLKLFQVKLEISRIYNIISAVLHPFTLIDIIHFLF